ncbi:MAG: IS110 family transposase [Acidimicrobiales bacterium]
MSRKRLDVCVLEDAGQRVVTTLCPPDADGLRHLVAEIDALGGPVAAAIVSMNGARFVHDTLELMGWDVEIADAQKTNGLGPLACKTDKIDAWVLAELSPRDLVPSIWLPTPGVRAERERARFRLHLVRHRVILKNLWTEGMAAEDGPWLSGRCVPLGSMLHRRCRRSRNLHAPGTNPRGQSGGRWQSTQRTMNQR